MGPENGSAKEIAMNVYGVDFTKPAEAQAKIGKVLMEKGYSSPDFKTLADLAEQYKQEQDGESEDLKMAA